MPVCHQLLEQCRGFRPEWATSPLIALPMQPDALWSIEIDIDDPQVGDFLHPRSGVIEEHEKSPISKRKRSLSGQALEQSLDFFAFEIIGLRWCSALDGDSLHALRFSQHLWILKG